MNVENMDNFIDLVTPEVINLVSPSPLPTIDWETPMFGCNDNICTCYNLDSPTYYNNSEPSEVINLVSPCPSPLPTTIDWETLLSYQVFLDIFNVGKQIFILHTRY